MIMGYVMINIMCIASGLEYVIGVYTCTCLYRERCAYVDYVNIYIERERGGQAM